MKRVFGAMTVMAVLAGVTSAEAQYRDRDYRDREILYHKFDLGLYAGGAWTSDWFSLGGENFGSGWSPAFGATGTYWFNRRLGTRLNGTYMPMRSPTTSAEFITLIDNETQILVPDALRNTSGWPVNTWMADLSLTFKPWMNSGTNFLASSYAWLGGGALWTNFSSGAPDLLLISGDTISCVADFTSVGLCYDAGNRTVPQMTFGLGFDILGLGGNVGFYGELGGNVYRAPVRNEFDGILIEPAQEIPFDLVDFSRKTAFTGRATAGVKVAFGQVLAPVVPVPPAPAPPPPPAERAIQVCVVDNGQLGMISAVYRPATGDTLVNGRPFNEVHPVTVPNYAAGASWFLQSNEITFNNNAHVKYGVTRMITPAQLQRVGEYQGTPVFAEANTTAPWQVVYLPVRPGCEFQPYQLREVIRPRG
ncbi:MAG: hypothetical protein LBG44_11910 [Gemmatimonadota bacterium]|jgi:hypothetical protein|nr:hypothetical protein [Gemmatimonadota bacterium]